MPPPPSFCCKQGVKYHRSAADFLIQTVTSQPGEVVVLALGPLTNIALAMQKDPSFAEHVVSKLHLSGSSLVPQFNQMTYTLSLFWHLKDISQFQRNSSSV